MSSDFSGRKANGPSGVSRRRFVQGLAAGGAIAGLGLWPKAIWAMKSPGQLTVLAGTEFDLAIGETPVNFTGRTRPAITVNGSLPAPLLRWREGTTVNLRVSNALPPKATTAVSATAERRDFFIMLLPVFISGLG